MAREITRCDSNGVPCLIQKWRYLKRGSNDGYFEVLFFDNSTIDIYPIEISGDLPINSFTTEEIDDSISKIAEKKWRALRPFRRKN